MVYLLPFGGPQPRHGPSRDVAATTQDYDVADAIDTTIDVTIGLPVYNGEDYLDVAITGLRTQSYPSFRLLVVNGGGRIPTSSV